MKNINVIYLILFSFIVISCRDKNEITNCENNPNISFLENKDYKKNQNTNSSILILNEGGYTYGNASITQYLNDGSIAQNGFKIKNGYVVGDILQSFYKSPNTNELYLIINNSQKIEVVDRKNLERIRTITGFTSPRYMTTIKDLAFVTDIYANGISVFNLTTNCEYSSIKMKGWTEQIFNINDRIFVIERSEVGASTIFANLVELEVNIIENKEPEINIVKRTSIPIEPQSVVLDNDYNLWILSSGKESENIFPTITKFNTNSNSIEKSFSSTSYSNIPQNLCEDDGVFYYNKGNDIYTLNNTSISFSSTKIFTSVAQNIYNLSFDTKNKLIYICDAKDYTSNGEVLVYSINGTLVKTIPTGVIPNKIIF